MAGTLGGLQLSIQADSAGAPLSGAFLYVYAANTSTPADTFQDYGLTGGLELPFPIVTDSAGRIPPFWVADGAYRARLTTSAGVEVFDYASIQAIGPSAGTGESGSGTTDETAVFSTGDFLWQPIAGTRSGWVRANGRTMGSAASGGTERANADTQPLYEWLWNNFSDALCPVATGRGANAAADFAANKAIGTVDMRGRSFFGLDDMGNTAAAVIAAGTPTAAASSGGDETSTALIAHTHTQQGAHTSGAGGAHTHSFSGSVSFNDTSWTSDANFGSTASAGSSFQPVISVNSGTISGTVSGTTGSEASHTHSTTLTGQTASTGSGASFNKMPPYRLGSIYIKL